MGDRVRRMSPRWKLAFFLATFVMAAIWVASVAAIGIAVVDYYESWESLQHWEKELKAQEAKPPEPKPYDSFDNPHRRVRDLRERMDMLPERLFPAIVMLALSSLLIWLSARAILLWLRARRTR
jgi:hypothetical protein